MSLCKRMGLDEDFYSVSIPLGATINMDGAAVTITVFALAVAHTLGVEGGSLLLIPMACSFFGISNDVAMQTVAIGFIIGVVQDPVETALNSSGDVFFTTIAEQYDRRKQKKQSK